jgi:hypothetical protein
MSAEAIAIAVVIWLLLVVGAALLLYGKFSTTVDHPERYHEGQTVYIDGRRYVITRVEGNRIRWRRG